MSIRVLIVEDGKPIYDRHVDAFVFASAEFEKGNLHISFEGNGISLTGLIVALTERIDQNIAADDMIRDALGEEN